MILMKKRMRYRLPYRLSSQYRESECALIQYPKLSH